MTETEADKIDLETPDLADAKRAALTALFPGAIEDGVLDSARIGELVDLQVAAVPDGRERFGLQWAGKQEAVRSLLTPSQAALLPDVESSIDFDSAQNLFIEGDNLEVLKVLQKSYNDKIKLIYIDPPYNTGGDFVYSDDFQDGLRGYLKYTGQLDEEGKRTSTDVDTSGRRHSKWLSMMYPRLMLARNVLRQDGFIFVSINDVEVAALRMLMDEIFGSENFLAQMIWLKGREGGNDNAGFGQHHEYVLAYSRNFASASSTIALDPKDTSRHKTDLPEPNRVVTGDEVYRDGEPFQLVNLSKQKDYQVSIPLDDGSTVEWPSYAPQKTIDEYIRIGKVFVGAKGVPYVKSFLADEASGTKPSTLIDSNWGTTKAGGIALRELFGSSKVFSYPKPPKLIQRLIQVSGVDSGDIVLDFFAGSGSTAHAVALQNQEDGRQRRAISINIPEATDVKSEARNAGFNTVSEFTLARILKVVEVVPGAAEMGLRVFRLGRSNFRGVGVGESLFDLSETTLVDSKPDWLAVAVQVFTVEGVSLDAQILRSGSIIEAGGVAVVATTDLNERVVEEVLNTAPRVVVFSEDGFSGKDALKANAVANARNKGITLKTV